MDFFRKNEANVRYVLSTLKSVYFEHTPAAIQVHENPSSISQPDGFFQGRAVGFRDISQKRKLNMMKKDFVAF